MAPQTSSQFAPQRPPTKLAARTAPDVCPSGVGGLVFVPHRDVRHFVARGRDGGRFLSACRPTKFIRKPLRNAAMSVGELSKACLKRPILLDQDAIPARHHEGVDHSFHQGPPSVLHVRSVREVILQ